MYYLLLAHSQDTQILWCGLVKINIMCSVCVCEVVLIMSYLLCVVCSQELLVCWMVCLHAVHTMQDNCLLHGMLIQLVSTFNVYIACWNLDCILPYWQHIAKHKFRQQYRLFISVFIHLLYVYQHYQPKQFEISKSSLHHTISWFSIILYSKCYCHEFKEVTPNKCIKQRWDSVRWDLSFQC